MSSHARSAVTAPSSSPRATHHGALLALLLVALNLRPALASLGPVLEQVRNSLQLSYGIAGLLSTLPIICMGLFASIAMPLSARFGMHNTILGTTLLIGVATLLRLHAALPTQLLSMFIVGAGIAVLGPLLSAYIKQQFAERSTRVSGYMTSALCMGAALAAGSSASLANYLGWPCALSSWALLAFFAAWRWYRTRTDTANRKVQQGEAAAASVSHLPWRNLRAWQLMLTFGINSWVFYSLLAWLAPAYVSLGLTTEHAGQLLGVFAIAQIIGTTLVSLLPAQQRERRPALLLGSLCTISGLLGMWLAPLAATYLWMSLLGAGTAGLFAISMILPLDYSDSPQATGDWTAMMCSGGYLLAATGPYLCGALRDLSGSYTTVFATLLTMSAIALLSGLLLRPTNSQTHQHSRQA